MSEIINWINSRGLKGEDYLGDLCKKNHEYLDTGKSVRCKPTDRPNGKCVCCSKESRDKSYRNNSQTKKDYYEKQALLRNISLKKIVYSKKNEKTIKSNKISRY